MLLERIKADLKQAMKNKDEEKRDAIRMIMGEIPRLNLKVGQFPTTEQLESIIRKLVKSEKIVIEASDGNIEESRYISILNEYLPKMMTKNDVCLWLMENKDKVNLDNFNPQIKAMGPIMKHLKGKVDGNVVREILEWNDSHKKSCHMV